MIRPLDGGGIDPAPPPRLETNTRGVMTEDAALPAAGASDTSTGASSRRRSALLFLRDVALIIIAALLISFIIKTFLIRSFYIPSPSMSDTLVENDRIIVNQLVPELVPLERGDVVVFTDPGSWLTPQPEAPQPPLVAAAEWLGSIVGLSAPDSDEHLVKRLIGLPGDRVVCCNDLGQMSVNGVPLEEPYIRGAGSGSPASERDFQIDVPEGTLWVMGDNRGNSSDSRFNGTVPISDVVGRAFVISWPLDRWTWLDNYPLVFDGVDEARASVDDR